MCFLATLRSYSLKTRVAENISSPFLVSSSYLHWYCIHVSRLFIINIVRKPRTRYVVSNKHGVGVKSGRVKLQSVFFSKNDDKHDTVF